MPGFAFGIPNRRTANVARQLSRCLLYTLYIYIPNTCRACGACVLWCVLVVVAPQIRGARERAVRLAWLRGIAVRELCKAFCAPAGAIRELWWCDARDDDAHRISLASEILYACSLKRRGEGLEREKRVNTISIA